MEVQRIGHIGNHQNFKLLESFLKDLRIKVVGDRLKIKGIKISLEVESYLRKIVTEKKISRLEIDPDLAFYQLEAIFRSPKELEKSLAIGEKSLCLFRPLTPEEAFQAIDLNFSRSAAEGMEKFVKYQSVISSEKAKELFRKHLSTMASLFAAQGVNEEWFEKILAWLGSFNDQKLNQEWVQELKDTKKHDLVWVIWALEYFRKKYPDELWFHKVAGEINFNEKAYDCALEAYKEAQRLRPEDKNFKEMVKRCERLFRRQIEEVNKRREQEFTQSWNELWQNPQEEVAISFLNKFFFSEVAEFIKMKIPPRYEPLAKVYRAIELLRKVVEKREDASLLALLEHYQLKLLEELFTHVVKGHVITQPMWEIIKSAVESDKFVLPDLMPKVEKAVTGEGHRNKEICSFILNNLFTRHLLEGHKLFQKGKIQEALGEIDLALEAYPVSSLALAEKGSVLLALGDTGQAEKLLEEALKYDPNNFIALERLIWVKGFKGEIFEVKNLAEKVLSLEEREGWKSIRGVARKTALTNLCYACLHLWEEKQEKSSFLALAEKYALQLEQEFPKEKSAVFYYLAQVYFGKKELERALTFTRQFVNDPEFEVGKIFSLFSPLWVVFEELSSEERIKARDLFLELEEKIFPKALTQEELAGKIIDFACTLLEAEMDDIAERLLFFYLERGKKDTAFFQALYAQALLHYRLKEFPQAAHQLLKIIKDPQSRGKQIYDLTLGTTSDIRLHAYSFLGQVYRAISQQQADGKKRRGIMNEGRKILLRAKREYPNDPVLLNTLGVIFDELGDQGRATLCFLGAMEADPFFIFAYLNLVDLWQNRGRKKEASLKLNDLRARVEEILKSGKRTAEILKVDFYVFLEELSRNGFQEIIGKILEAIFQSSYGEKAQRLYQAAQKQIQSNS